MYPELAKHSEKLNYFYTIATTGSLQACARKLGLSAPTLSYNLKQLEEIIGKKLMHRSNKGIQLTEAGELLLAFCKRYFKELEQVEKMMHNPELSSVTRIKVGTYHSIAIYFWPHVMNAIVDDSTLSVSISTDRSDRILEALYRRDIDLALTVESGNLSGIVQHELYRDSYAFYCSRKAEKSLLSKKDIGKNTIIYIPDAQDKNRKTISQYLFGWDLNFAEEFQLDSFEVIAEFTKRNYGIGILPTKVAENYKDEIQLVKIEDLESTVFGEHRFFLSYREDLSLPQRLMNVFLEASLAAVTQVEA